MGRFLTEKLCTSGVHLSKTIALALFISFGIWSCSESQESSSRHYSDDKIVEFLSDKILVEGLLDYVEYGNRDSIANLLDYDIWQTLELDSALIFKDLETILIDPEESSRIFNLVKSKLVEELDGTKD